MLEDIFERIENSPLYLTYHVSGKPVIRHVRGTAIRGMESESTLSRLADAEGSTELHGGFFLATALNLLPRTSLKAFSNAHPDMAAVVRHLRGSEVGSRD